MYFRKRIRLYFLHYKGRHVVTATFHQQVLEVHTEVNLSVVSLEFSPVSHPAKKNINKEITAYFCNELMAELCSTFLITCQEILPGFTFDLV